MKMPSVINSHGRKVNVLPLPLQNGVIIYSHKQFHVSDGMRTCLVSLFAQTHSTFRLHDSNIIHKQNAASLTRASLVEKEVKTKNKFETEKKNRIPA